MKMRCSTGNVRTLGAVCAASLLLCACRSDGGIGRRDALRGMRWTLDTLAAQHARDVDQTAQNVDDLEAWCANEVTHSTDELQATLSMYLEGHARR